MQQQKGVKNSCTAHYLHVLITTIDISIWLPKLLAILLMTYLLALCYIIKHTPLLLYMCSCLRNTHTRPPTLSSLAGLLTWVQTRRVTNEKSSSIYFLIYYFFCASRHVTFWLALGCLIWRLPWGSLLVWRLTFLHNHNYESQSINQSKGIQKKKNIYTLPLNFGVT
jgi:hypothetical protein